MGTTINSVDNMLASARDNGMLSRIWFNRIANSTTAALNTCGSVSVQRLTNPFVMPSVGGGLTGMYCTSIDVLSSDTCGWMACLEYTLGTLTVSTNAYSHGSSMPTKLDPGDPGGSSITTAATLIMAVVDTAVTATTPVLTFNYTNQDGTTGRSGSITLPTNPAVQTAFLCSPHLQSGDYGIRALSSSGPNGLSINTGSAGVIKLYGLLPLSVGSANAGSGGGIDPLLVSGCLWLVEAGDTISFWRFGTTSNGEVVAMINGIASN